MTENVQKANYHFLLKFCCIFGLLLCSCQTQYCETIIPIISSPTPKVCGNSLLGFPDFTREESRESWSKEAFIARSFALELDLYRAITGYKRALFLLPPKKLERRQEIEYAIILCYYLGEKFNDVVETFEKSSLIEFPLKFAARNDLLIILYDSYQKIDSVEKAGNIQNIIDETDPCLSDRLQLSQSIKKGDLNYLVAHQEEKSVENLVNSYYLQKKSVQQAEFLNAVFPGAGYYYVGQKQTALTSLVINGLFAAATYYFFDQGNIAAGLIVLSLESGWYFGGIKGAGLAAREYNERLYENLAREVLCKQQLFPSFMIQHTF